MDITKLSEQELKALAYDQILLLNQAQANIAAIQAELQNRAKAPSVGATKG